MKNTYSRGRTAVRRRPVTLVVTEKRVSTTIFVRINARNRVLYNWLVYRLKFILSILCELGLDRYTLANDRTSIHCVRPGIPHVVSVGGVTTMGLPEISVIGAATGVTVIEAADLHALQAGFLVHVTGTGTGTGTDVPGSEL